MFKFIISLFTKQTVAPVDMSSPRSKRAVVSSSELAAYNWCAGNTSDR